MCKKRGLVTAGLCCCVSMLGWAAQYSEAGPGKVTICHKADSVKYFQITVSSRALPSHLRHGDCVVDDGVACTIDSCDGEVGCINAPDDTLCDDGNACTTDTCDPSPASAGCVYTPVNCDDGDACTTDSCDPASGCVYTPNIICGDGLMCSPEECDDGGESASCNSDCTTSLCGDGIKNVHAGEQCDDGNTVPGDGCGAACQNECEIPHDSCNAPTAVSDGTRSYCNLGATTDGPDEPATCDFSGSSNVESDIWYCYTATCSGTALASLCGSDYDTMLAVYAGCGCPAVAPLACSDDDCGTGSGAQSRVEFPATAGATYLVRVGGYLGEQGDGRLTIGCNVDACGNGSGDCFTASPTDTPGCGDATCCEEICALDQFCCDVNWDTNCAGEASGFCAGGSGFPACGAPNTRSCDTPATDVTPGCAGEACCNAVCMDDPYCCLEEWDEICVDEAAALPSCP